MKLDPNLITLIFLVGLPAVILAIGFWRFQSKSRRRETFLMEMSASFQELGAREIAPHVYQRGNTIYSVDANPSPLASHELSIRLSRYCDSVFEFVPENIKDDMAPELAEYLKTVRPQLEGIHPDRWKSLSKHHFEVVFSKNQFPDRAYSTPALARDLAALDHCATTPLRKTYQGAYVTCREGFEKKMPTWHWTPEQQAALPENVKRFVFSFYHGDAYLSLPIVAFLSTLAGGDELHFLTDRPDLNVVRRGFGDVVQQDGAVVSFQNPEAAVAADHYFDGMFFQGLLSGAVKPLAMMDRRNLHTAALTQLKNVSYYCRRLFDDEHAWYSGEYEILSTALTGEEVRTALRALADKYDATFVELDCRFSRRLLREERMDVILEAQA